MLAAFVSALAAGSLVAQQSRQTTESVVTTVSGLRDTTWRMVSQTEDIRVMKLDTLARVNFWRKIMNLSPDSGLLSAAATRKIYFSCSAADWNKLGDEGQKKFRDSVRLVNNLSDSAQLLFTRGKNDFYDAAGVVSQIDRAVPIFTEQGVDPFYAKSILLIESPGKLQKSNVGAFGAFQLMKSVAIKMGLKVNKYVDERKDFDKSAWAAAKLIRTVCIPYTNSMLEKRGIQYCEDDLWYKLLVLHVYHAGAGNVDKVLTAINPCEGNMQLIMTMWQTKAGGFGNASQNYSQLALAALLELDAVILNEERSSTGKQGY
ncbi:MAG: transglycosylase SLT domain-containing protein [Bacteroidia bacterium]